jgi:ABC-2 type transport system ATP-binding protein
VVLDEPTNGLDPNQILEIRHLIKEIAEERTVILSTHILSEVQATCDYIYMVEQGSFVFSGTVEEFDSYIAPNTLAVTLMEAPSIEELAKLEGVIDAEELGGNRFRLKFTDAREVVERIVKTSVEKDWHLTEIGVEKNSLDSIFAELSKKNN